MRAQSDDDGDVIFRNADLLEKIEDRFKEEVLGRGACQVLDKDADPV